MKKSCLTYILLFLWMLLVAIPAKAQISETEIYADIDKLILYAQHGLGPASGEIVVELLEKITTNPDPYLDVMRRDFVIPSDAQELAHVLTVRRGMMLMLLGKIDTEASREILRNLYRGSARRVDSLQILYQEARDSGAPYEDLKTIISAKGIAAMIEGDALTYLGRYGDKELLPELVARYDTTDTVYKIGIELYFEDVGEPFPPPDDPDDTCHQIPAEVDIAFRTTSVWATGYNAEVTITNTGSETIRGWRLDFDLAPEITSLWNGLLTSEGSRRSVTDADHNGVIAPGQSVTFGFQVQSPTVVEPSGYMFNEADCAGGEPAVDIAFRTTSVWGTGYNAEITLTNTGDQAIRGWQLAFDLVPEVTNLWNGLLMSEGSRRTVTDADHNGVIVPGQSVTVGFQVQSPTVVEPSAYQFSFWALSPPQ